MIPKIWLINLALAVLVVFSGIKAADVWFDDDGSVLDSKVSERPAERAPEKKISREAVPPETAYEVVLENNIFSPSRKEYLPVQESGDDSVKESAELKIPGKKVVLYGVVLMDGYKKALVTNLDKTSNGKDIVWVQEGQSLGSFRVSRIEKKKLIVQENNQEFEISLYAEDKPARANIPVDTGKPSVITAKEPVQTTQKTVPASSPPSAVNQEKQPDVKQKRGVTQVKEGDEEFEIIDTPFGPFKRKVK